jgi:hypothetical protein
MSQAQQERALVPHSQQFGALGQLHEHTGGRPGIRLVAGKAENWAEQSLCVVIV